MDDELVRERIMRIEAEHKLDALRALLRWCEEASVPYSPTVEKVFQFGREYGFGDPD